METAFAVCAALTVVAAVVPGVGAAGGAPPLAEAGLDQRVERGSTVFLDGTGSRDPGGGVAAYEWTIRTPGGEIATPADRSAARTRFVPTERGTHAATLTVVDGAGERASDTLYVTVGSGGGALRGGGPRVGVEGPRTVAAGATVELRAVGAFDRVAWSTNRSDVRIDPRGENASATVDAPPGATVAVRARAFDATGVAVATHRIRVRARNVAGTYGGYALDLTEFVATHPATGRDAFASPVPVSARNGTAAVRFRAAAEGDRKPTYEFRFAGETVNRTVDRWDDATLVREFSFAPGAFADGPVERNVTLFVRGERWPVDRDTDEATRTLTFRRADGAREESDRGAGGGDSAGGEGAATGEGSPSSPSPPSTGPVVGLRP